eukprot:c23048_g1_i2 orf=51-725(+)
MEGLVSLTFSPLLASCCTTTTTTTTTLLLCVKKAKAAALHAHGSLHCAAAVGNEEGGGGCASSDSAGTHGCFVKSLDTIYPRAPCLFCRGEGVVPCARCSGRGFLAKGGYHKNNPIDLDRVIGSKWTAVETTFGWRHFIVMSKQRGLKKDWFLELAAACDENIRFWINAKNLKDRERWSMGWLQIADILRSKHMLTPCKSCKGKARMPCQACDRHWDRINVMHV